MCVYVCVVTFSRLTCIFCTCTSPLVKHIVVYFMFIVFMSMLLSLQRNITCAKTKLIVCFIFFIVKNRFFCFFCFYMLSSKIFHISLYSMRHLTPYIAYSFTNKNIYCIMYRMNQLELYRLKLSIFHKSTQTSATQKIPFTPTNP